MKERKKEGSKKNILIIRKEWHEKWLAYLETVLAGQFGNFRKYLTRQGSLIGMKEGFPTSDPLALM